MTHLPIEVRYLVHHVALGSTRQQDNMVLSFPLAQALHQPVAALTVLLPRDAKSDLRHKHRHRSHAGGGSARQEEIRVKEMYEPVFDPVPAGVTMENVGKVLWGKDLTSPGCRRWGCV